MKKNIRIDLRKLVLCGIFAALGIVLGRSFCTVYITESLKITLDKVPVLLAGIWLGPLYGAAVAAVSDIIGAAVLSSYGWTPLLTVSPVLMGLISGITHIYIRKIIEKHNIRYSKPVIILCTAITVVLTETLTSFLLQTLFLTFLYGSTYAARLSTRLPVCAIVALAETVIISLLQCSSAVSTAVGKYINRKRRS
ncbi:MAG: folate family ECF transporter S component [Clostridia bacterium]|nr:folate family ECF transporter S component [Clostridia bacterium]